MSTPSIIAVGIHLVFDIDQLKRDLSKYIPETELASYTFLTEYQAGVFYGSGVGSWTDIATSQETMAKWYNKHKDQPATAYVNKMYRTNKIILLVGTFEGKYFSVIVSNMTKGVATFLHKKNAERGHYGEPVRIDRIAFTGKLYKFDQFPTTFTLAK